MAVKRTIKTESEWRRELTPQQFEVCRNKGTEHAFSGEYYDCHDDGKYRCACCGNELFDSTTKFESGSGWPSFHSPVTTDAVTTENDLSYGMRRTEVMCGGCDSHLGHVFDDGPDPTGLRYCINSVALTLDKNK